MPITKDGSNNIVLTPPTREDLALQTGVSRSDAFAICDKIDLLKQLAFDTSAQTSNTTVTLASGANASNITLTLPTTSGTLSTTSGITQLTGGVTAGPGSGSQAATVVTNANLTGPITSTGNATAVAAQTGTGTTFVMQASPTLTTPNLGTPSAGVMTNVTGTAASLTAGTATNAVNIATTGSGAAANFYPLFVASTTNSNQAANLGSNLYFNPNAGSLYAPGGPGYFFSTYSVGAGGVSSTRYVFQSDHEIDFVNSGSVASKFVDGEQTGQAYWYNFNGTSSVSLNSAGLVSLGTYSTNGTSGELQVQRGGNVSAVGANLIVSTVGKGLQVKGGTNARIGNGTLASGTATISNTSVTANSRIFLQDNTTGALTNVGSLTVGTVTAGTSFVVNSTNALDASTFWYFIVEQT